MSVIKTLEWIFVVALCTFCKKISEFYKPTYKIVVYVCSFLCKVINYWYLCRNKWSIIHAFKCYVACSQFNYIPIS